MTNFEKTPLYDRMADFISIMDEDELRELAEVCKVKADLLQQKRLDRQRDELEHNLLSAIKATQDAGFAIHIGYQKAADWTIHLQPDEECFIEIHYMGK